MEVPPPVSSPSEATPRPARPVPPPLRPPTPGRRPARRSARRPLRRKKPGSSKKSHLPIRKELSAGGVVVRQEGEAWYVALLKTEHKRGEVWVLPKGHVELHTGERVSEAARREVQEEAGLTDLSVKNQLGVTRFKFQVEDAVVYKTVHYFLMTTQQKTLHPQAEEGLLEAAWFPLAEAVEKLEYDTDQDIVRRAAERITGVAPAARRSLPAGRQTPPLRRRRPPRVHT